MPRRRGKEMRGASARVFMLGYVTPEKSELRLREYEVYGAYYCGICRSAGARYGQLPRLLLNYDFVFLAMLLSSALDDKPDKLDLSRCLAHPMRKRPFAARNAFIDYAADMMLLLSYCKMKDDRRDEKSLPALAGELMLRGIHVRIREKYPDKSRLIFEALDSLNELENESEIESEL